MPRPASGYSRSRTTTTPRVPPALGQRRDGKIEPGGLAFALEIDAFRINPGHAPVSPRAAAQTPRVIGDCVGMMLVHVPKDLRFRRLESGSIRGKQ